MVEEVITIKAEVQQANKAIGEVAEKVDNVQKQSEETANTTKKMASGFKAVGGAIKAMGIGLVIAAFAKLTEAMNSNQRITDAIGTAFNAISIVFNQVTTALLNVFDQTSAANGGFDAMQKVVSGLMTIALTPLQLAFYGIKLAVQQAMLAWENSFFGDKDPETIKTLTEGIIETQNSIIETGEKAIQAGKDIYNNFAEAAGEVADFGKKAVDEISKINVQSAIEQGKALQEAKNNAQLAAAELQGLIEKYDRQAEIQRQIRDDERLSIDERIAANKRLGEILQEQLDAQLEQANLQVRAARMQIQATGNSIENQLALKEALNEVAAVEAQIAGFQSEQLVNEASLQRERVENLNEIALIGASENERKMLEFEQELERQQQLIERTITNEEEKNAALLAAKNEYDSKVKELEKAASDRSVELAKKEAQTKSSIANQLIGAIMANLEQGSVEQKALAVAQATWNTFEAVTAALGAKPYGAWNIAQAVATGLFGLAQVRSILQTNPASGGGGGAAPSGASFTPPAVNIPGQANVNSIIQGFQTGNTPVQAYVVSGEVNSGAELERKRLANATFG